MKTQKPSGPPSGSPAVEADRHLRLMIENVSDYAIMSLDSQGRVTSWNVGVQRIKGYARQEILGQTFACFYLPEQIAAGRPAEVLAMARAEGHFQEEGWRVRKGGERFWASVLISHIQDDDGRSIGYTKITRDLSERRASAQMLDEANVLQAAIIDAAPYAIIATDASGLITKINPVGERMLWYTSAELVGRKNFLDLHVPEEIIRRAEQLSELGSVGIKPGFDVFTHDARKGLIEEHEWTHIRKDGSRFPVHLAVTALHDKSRSIVGYLGIAYDITERKRRESYIEHLAHHDQLTGLPNRTLLSDRLSQALLRAERDRTKVGVLMIDLDHFKRVNDSLGHHVGDQLLKTIAERIQTSVRDADTVARMGGDEFVVILPDLEKNADADRIAAVILERISVPVVAGQEEIAITSSIGVSCYPDDGAVSDVLLKRADVAMYRTKRIGRSGYSHYTEDMEKAAKRKLALEGSLRRAFQQNLLEVHYQPQACMKTGRINSMEALLRWPDVKLGLIPPTTFIPVAEDSGLIVALGDWVLRTACRDARRLAAHLGFPMTVAVNLSARQFTHGSLESSTTEALSGSGLDPKQLELEITESLLMNLLDDSGPRLEALRAMGVSVVMDDFGTGFSSLSYLSQLPINGLKIDRSFVSRMTRSSSDRAIVQAITAMAHSLDFKVIAEGVETSEQMQALQRCMQDSEQIYDRQDSKDDEFFNMQGFRLCRPMPIEQLCADFEGLQISSRQMIQQTMH